MSRPTIFRKATLAAWPAPCDPSTYGILPIRMDAALAFLERLRSQHAGKLTVTHLVLKALADALAAHPQANVLARGRRVYARQSVDLSLLVFMRTDGKDDLSALKIEAADRRSLLDIATWVERGAVAARSGSDTPVERARRLLRWLPTRLMALGLRLLTYLAYELNLPLWGLPRDPLGSAVVTSIGSLGLPIALPPLVPYAGVPLVVAPGAVVTEAVVQDGVVVPGQVMYLSAAADHRLVDGALGASIAKWVRQALEHPEAHFGTDGGAASQGAEFASPQRQAAS